MKSISLYVAMCVSLLPYKGEAYQQLPPLMSKCCLSDRPQVEDTEPSGEWRCRYTTDTRKAAGRCEEHLKAVQNRSIGTLVALSSQVFAEGSRRCQLFFFLLEVLGSLVAASVHYKINTGTWTPSYTSQEDGTAVVRHGGTQNQLRRTRVA